MKKILKIVLFSLLFLPILWPTKVFSASYCQASLPSSLYTDDPINITVTNTKNAAQYKLNIYKLDGNGAIILPAYYEGSSQISQGDNQTISFTHEPLPSGKYRLALTGSTGDDCAHRTDINICNDRTQSCANVAPSPTPRGLNPLPSLTPRPTSTQTFIQCEGSSRSRVLTSINHPFPAGSSNSTFTFENLPAGNYRMAAELNPLSLGNGNISGWASLCQGAAVGPDASGRYKFSCTPDPAVLSTYQPNPFSRDITFQLQKEEPTWPTCTDPFRGIIQRCTANDGYSNSAFGINYASCQWKVQQQSTCNLAIRTENINETQAKLVLRVAGLPPFQDGQTNYGYMIYKDGAENYTQDIMGVLTGTYRPDFEYSVPPLFERGHTYKFAMTYKGPIVCPAAAINQRPCIVPNSLCVPTSIEVPLGNIPATPTPDSSYPPGGLPAGRAFQVCKVLCEQIEETPEEIARARTDPNFKSLRRECRDLDWKISESIPSLGWVTWGVWNGITVPASVHLEVNDYEKIINQFIQANGNRNLNVLKCVSCFSRSGAYTALGCIETQPERFIARVFAIAIPIMGGILLLGFLKIGFSIITSGGDPKKMEENRNFATSMIAGALFLLGSVFIYGFIGGTVLGIPGFG